MVEQTTETTVVAQEATQQGAAGAEVQTTTQKPTEQVETTQATTAPETAPKSESATEKPSVSAQERINRMYARLQAERAARQKAEDAARMAKPVATGDDGAEVKPLTEMDVRNILRNQESEKRYYDSEARVIERHPEAINEDGTYNLNDEFVKAYIDIGRENPGLLQLENGPELAEAMAEKRTGISYTKGRKDEAKRLQTVTTNAHTSTSTTAIPRKTGPSSNLTDIQRKIATRMGLTEAEYIAQQGSNKIIQKNWAGGRKA